MSIRNVYDTAANLTSNNPTLAAGELGIESDTGLVKVGDGSTAWTSLGYASPAAITLWHHATDMSAYAGALGTGTQSTSLRAPYKTFPDSAAVATSGPTPLIPAGWNTANFYLWTVNHAGVASNACQFSVYHQTYEDGDLGNAPVSVGASGAVTISGTQYTIERHLVSGAAADVSTAAGLTGIGQAVVYRDGSNGADTFAGAVGVLALEIVRAS